MMKNILIIFILFCLIASSSSNLNISKAIDGHIMITELMANPLGDDNLFEWIELQNQSTTSKSSGNLKINGTQLPSFDLAPNEIVIIARSTSSIINRYPLLTNKLLTFPTSLSNSGSTLILTDNMDSIIQSFQYSTTQEDKSFELLSGGCNIIQISKSNTIGSPSTSCFETPFPSNIISITPSENPFSNYSNLISINSVNPCSTIESLELRNNDSYEINLSQWRIEDKSGTSQNLTEKIIEPGKSLSINITKISLNDTGDLLTLIDPSGNQKDIFIYEKCANKGDIFSIRSDKSEVLELINTTIPMNILINDNSNLKYPKLYLN